MFQYHSSSDEVGRASAMSSNLKLMSSKLLSAGPPRIRGAFLVLAPLAAHCDRITKKGNRVRLSKKKPDKSSFRQPRPCPDFPRNPMLRRT
jgi:hypothetical protein